MLDFCADRTAWMRKAVYSDILITCSVRDDHMIEELVGGCLDSGGEMHNDYDMIVLIDPDLSYAMINRPRPWGTTIVGS